MDDVLVKAVLDECRRVLDSVEATKIGVVLCEEQCRIAVAVQPVGPPQFGVFDKDARLLARRRKTEPGSNRPRVPTPTCFGTREWGEDAAAQGPVRGS